MMINATKLGQVNFYGTSRDTKLSLRHKLFMQLFQLVLASINM